MSKRGLLFSAIMLMMATPVFAAVNFNIGDAKATIGAGVWVEAGWDYQFHGDVPTAYISDKETQQYVQIDDPSNINLKVDYKKLGAYTEIRFTNSSEFEIELFSIYGQYKFDDRNSILFGKAPVAFAMMAPKQNLYNANCLDGYGGLDPWKEAYQIRYSFRSEKIGLDVAIEEIKRDPLVEENAPGTSQIQNYLPALSVNLNYTPVDIITINPSAYVQQYKLKPKGQGAVNQDITTYAFALGIEADLKPVNIQAEGWWGQNLSVLGGLDARPGFFSPIEIDYLDKYLTPMGSPQWDGNKLKDVTTYGGWLQIEAPISKLTPRIGGGYQRSSTGIVEQDYERHIFTWGAFANCDIMITDYLNICPEFLYMYNGRDADKNFLGNGYNRLGYEAIGGVTMIMSF